MTNNYKKTIGLLILSISMITSQFISAKTTTIEKKDFSTVLTGSKATTKASPVFDNTECAGTSSEAQLGQGGSFSTGYNYSFVTSGTDVTITFELLDTDKADVGAYLWKQTPFSEILPAMTKTPGTTIFTETISGQIPGATISYACKFAFAGGQAVTKYFTYTVGNSCGGSGTTDTEAPTNFTATVGTITATSVELVLNGSDDSGAVTYTVTYGATTTSTSSASGVQKSFVISGLTPETAYSFSVTAKDATGNMATNNPIVLPATTLADSSTECAGTSSEAQLGQGGSFSTGYNYSFVTSGTDVTITFELLDTDKADVGAYLWQETPFSELLPAMTNTPGTSIFTKTISDQTVGSQISYACKFAYAGGQAVTKYFTYTVGNACGKLNVNSNELSKSVSLYPNPAKNVLNIEASNTPITNIEFYSVLGNKVLNTKVTNNVVNIESLSSGIYMVKMYTENNDAVVKKLIVE